MNIGIDIVKTERMNFFLEKADRMSKVFTESEIAYVQKFKDKALEHMAGHFAVKEAVVKALKTGFSGICPLDIELGHLGNGSPIVVGSDKLNELLDGRHIDVSIAHDGDVATAICIIN